MLVLDLEGEVPFNRDIYKQESWKLTSLTAKRIQNSWLLVMSHKKSHERASAKGRGSLISNTADLGTQKLWSHKEAQMQKRGEKKHMAHFLFISKQQLWAWRAQSPVPKSPLVFHININFLEGDKNLSWITEWFLTCTITNTKSTFQGSNFLPGCMLECILGIRLLPTAVHP